MFDLCVFLVITRFFEFTPHCICMRICYCSNVVENVALMWSVHENIILAPRPPPPPPPSCFISETYYRRRNEYFTNVLESIGSTKNIFLFRVSWSRKQISCSWNSWEILGSIFFNEMVIKYSDCGVAFVASKIQSRKPVVVIFSPFYVAF